jgi:predicted transcriptional regulator YdeE
VEVTEYSKVPAELSRVRIAENRYARVFSSRPHLYDPAHLQYDLEQWFPDSGREPADAPFFERYDERALILRRGSAGLRSGYRSRSDGGYQRSPDWLRMGHRE